jgi:PIN domain nuclease of toxin-antitoxin system
LGSHCPGFSAYPPFFRNDRLLVAQALTKPMRWLTHDTNVARYSDTIVFV